MNKANTKKYISRFTALLGIKIVINLKKGMYCIIHFNRRLFDIKYLINKNI